MVHCMYCGVGPHNGEEASIVLDLGIRGLAVVRTVQEMRAAEVPWRRVAAQIIGRDDAPNLSGVPRGRLCPACRKTHMTRLSPSTLWTDFIVRIAGGAQTLISNRSGGLRGLAQAVVDGDDASNDVQHVKDTEQGEVYEVKAKGRGRGRRSKIAG